MLILLSTDLGVRDDPDDLHFVVEDLSQTIIGRDLVDLRIRVIDNDIRLIQSQKLQVEFQTLVVILSEFTRIELVLPFFADEEVISRADLGHAGAVILDPGTLARTSGSTHDVDLARLVGLHDLTPVKGTSRMPLYYDLNQNQI